MTRSSFLILGYLPLFFFACNNEENLQEEDEEYPIAINDSILEDTINYKLMDSLVLTNPDSVISMTGKLISQTDDNLILHRIRLCALYKSKNHQESLKEIERIKLIYQRQYGMDVSSSFIPVIGKIKCELKFSPCKDTFDVLKYIYSKPEDATILSADISVATGGIWTTNGNGDSISINK